MTSFIVGIAIMCLTSLFFLFVFGFFAYLRYLKHKELMAFAEKGLLPPETLLRKEEKNNGTLRQAIILIGVGAALSIGLYPIGWIAMPGRLPLNLGPWMVAGLIPLFFGFGLLLIHFLPTLQSLVDHKISTLSNTQAHESGNAAAQPPHAGETAGQTVSQTGTTATPPASAEPAGRQAAHAEKVDQE